MDREYILNLLGAMKEIMAENREYLIELDSVVGDGDLGLTMSDGFAAGFEAAKATDETDIGKLLYVAGKSMASAVPSTMGTLMASGFMNAGKALKGKTEISLSDLYDFFNAYMEGVSLRGKAKVGEKTFLDGMDPAVQSLGDSVKKGLPLQKAAQNAYDSAKAGFEKTNTMIAVHGRAATRGEASLTLLDPGAAVAMLMMEAFLKSIR